MVSSAKHARVGIHGVVLGALVLASFLPGGQANASTPLTARHSQPVTYSPSTLVSARPAVLPSKGGSITVTGSGFSHGGITAINLVIGSRTLTVTRLRVNSARSLSFTAPKLPGALSAPTEPVSIMAISAGVTSSTATFRYADQPVVKSVREVVPTGNVPATSVVITGRNLSSATAVMFGRVSAHNFTVDSDSQITASIPPPPTIGTVHVRVSNGVLTSAASTNDDYTYHSIAAVTGSTPTQTAGRVGVAVTVTGTGFKKAGITGLSMYDSSGQYVRKVIATVATDSKLTFQAPSLPSGDELGSSFTFTVLAAGSSTGEIHLGYGAAPPPVPVITTLQNAASGLEGGGHFIIFGSGFSGASAVSVGVNAAESFTVINDTQINAVTPAASTFGPVDVRVTNIRGQSPITSADRLSYDSTAVVTSVSPRDLLAAGGAVVKIAGSGFANASISGVSLWDPNGAELTKTGSFTVVDDNTVTFLAPSKPQAIAEFTDLVVHLDAALPVAANTSAAVQYGAAPVITSLTPDAGSNDKTPIVTIEGSGFSDVTGVTFGGAQGTVVSSTSADELLVQPPGQTGVGPVPVVVQTGFGSSDPGPQALFTYGVQPDVHTVSPTIASAFGGQTVTVSGQDFSAGSVTGIELSNASTVVRITDVTVTDSNTLTFVVPPVTLDKGHALPFLIKIDSPFGSTGSTLLTLTEQPTVSGLSINTEVGAILPLTITGYAFTGATAVNFGAMTGARFTVVSDTEIDVTQAPTIQSPTGPPPGPLDVTVTTPQGTSAITPADVYTVSELATITSLSMQNVSATQATEVTAHGTGFTYDSYHTVVIMVSRDGSDNGVLAVTFTPINDNTATFVIPPVATTVLPGPGTYFVESASRFGDTSQPLVTVNIGYSPIIEGISRRGDQLAGGSGLTIIGSGFTGTTSVSFGPGTQPVDFTVVSDNQIQATVPASARYGTVSVRVDNPFGTSEDGPQTQFSYASQPDFESASLSEITTSGGQTVTVTGTGFAQAMMTSIDLVTPDGQLIPVGKINFINDTTIQFTTPPLPDNTPLGSPVFLATDSPASYRSEVRFTTQ